MANPMRSVMLSATVLIASVAVTKADIVTFDDRTGPSTFGAPNQTLVYTFADVAATFTGGTVLTRTTNLTADQTSAYGTISGENSNLLTITFSAPVNNFFNGNVTRPHSRLCPIETAAFNSADVRSSGQSRISCLESVRTRTALCCGLIEGRTEP